jgi:hypothetical protein
MVQDPSLPHFLHVFPGGLTVDLKEFLKIFETEGASPGAMQKFQKTGVTQFAVAPPGEQGGVAAEELLQQVFPQQHRSSAPGAHGKNFRARLNHPFRPFDQRIINVKPVIQLYSQFPETVQGHPPGHVGEQGVAHPVFHPVPAAGWFRLLPGGVQDGFQDEAGNQHPVQIFICKGKAGISFLTGARKPTIWHHCFLDIGGD